MIDDILEKNYVVSKLRPDIAELMVRWSQRSARYRDRASASFDQAYGEQSREKIDIFRSGAKKAPLLVYLHGGYWQRGDKSMYSFIAESFNAAGIDVAVVGYPLCPGVSLTELVGSVRRALVWLYRQADNLEISKSQINLCGNSAGGHLVGMMMATRWQNIDKALPFNLAKFGAPISALYQLEPLRQTSLNEAIGLDAEEAKAMSPQFLKPVTNAPMLTAVGAGETPVFKQQMQSFMSQWQSDSCRIEQHIEADADHFDIIERLGDSDSQIFQKVLRRLR